MIWIQWVVAFGGSALAGALKLKTWMLWALVAVAVVVAAFVPLRNWNVYHYYIGAKYFQEVGHFDLYECTLQATGSEQQRRNLETYSYTTGPANCTAAFTPDRWIAFQQDVKHLLNTPRILLDKGYNGTPPYNFFASILANLFKPEQLLWLDWLAIGAGIAVAVWSVGWRRGAYAALWIVTYNGTYDRIAGNYAQYVWLGLVIAGVALIHKRRAVGGALIGIAAALRVFPVFLLIGRSKRAVKMAALAMAIMGAVGLAAPGGISSAIESLQNMMLHSSYIRSEPYNLSLVNWLTLTSNYPLAVEEMARFELVGQMIEIPYNVPTAAWLALVPIFMMTTPLGIMYAVTTVSRYYYIILATEAIERSEKYIRWLLLINAILLAVMLVDKGFAMTWGTGLYGLYFLSLWKPVGVKTLAKRIAAYGQL